MKMRSGPGEGPGGQPRFAELVLSRFVDDFIPGPDDSSTRGDEGGDSPGGDTPGGGGTNADVVEPGGTIAPPRVECVEPPIARTAPGMGRAWTDGPRRGGGLRIRTDLPGCD